MVNKIIMVLMVLLGAHICFAESASLNNVKNNPFIYHAADMADNLTMRFWHLKYNRAHNVLQVINNNKQKWLTKNGSIGIDKQTNVIWVRDSASHIKIIENLIKHVDIPVRQVLIEARIVSVNSDFEQELGFNFAHIGHTNAEHAVAGDSDTAVDSGLARVGLAVFTMPDGKLLDLELSALEHEGKGEVISSPSLLTANQQTAIIESGEEIPYQEVSRSGGTTVAFKKAVLSLNVTPEILSGDRLLLHLQVNQDKPSSAKVLGVPTVDTRMIKTNVVVANKNTVVLGGIYEEDNEKNVEQVPFFGKLPLIGALFRYNNNVTRRRKLLIFITPRIV